MPEMPEVEVLRRQLEPLVAGREILGVHEGTHPRFSDGWQTLGCHVLGVRRRGKYLLLPTDAGDELVAHLGMTGQILWNTRPSDHVHLGLTFAHGVLWFRDPRRFGQVRVVPAGEYAGLPTLDQLGPEPFDPAFDAARVKQWLGASGPPVKAVLLQQTMVAGVGNYLADETLWTARIHPLTRILSDQECRDLREALVHVATESLEHGGVSERDYVHLDGSRGRYQEHLRAHGRAGLPCLRCGATLRKGRVAGRGTAWCPQCQVLRSPGPPHQR